MEKNHTGKIHSLWNTQRQSFVPEGSTLRDASPEGFVGPCDFLAVVGQDSSQLEAVSHHHLASVGRYGATRRRPVASIFVLACGSERGFFGRVFARLEDIEVGVS